MKFINKFNPRQAAANERQRKLQSRMMKVKPKNKKRQFFEKNIGDTILTGRIPEEDENESLLDETQPSRVSKMFTGRIDECDSTDEIQSNFRVSVKPKTRSARINHHLSAQNLFMGDSFNKNNSEDSSSS